MKFLTFTMFGTDKTQELAAVGDKIAANLPKGTNILCDYICMSPPFPCPPNTFVSFTIAEVESVEAMAATTYPVMLAGATIWRVPIMEIRYGAAAKAEKKYRG